MQRTSHIQNLLQNDKYFRVVKLQAFFIVFFCVVSAHAQDIQFGIVGGMHMCGIPSQKSTISDYHVSTRRGFFGSPQIGLTTSVRMNDHWNMVIESSWTQSGEHLYEKNERTFGNKFITEKWTDEKYNQLGFTIYPSYSFRILNLPCRLYLGYELSFGIAGLYQYRSKFVDVNDAFSTGLHPIEDESTFDPFVYADEDYYSYYENAGRVNHQVITGFTSELSSSLNLSLQVASGNYYQFKTGPLISDIYYGDISTSHTYHNLNYAVLLRYYFPAVSQQLVKAE